jgi:glutamine synthetase
MDAAANPYLALGGIVAAGLDGLERELSLPEPVLDDPADIPARKRRSMGIRQLPDSLGAAIEELERSTLLREAMGDVLFDSFLATRRAERDVFEGKPAEDVVRAHRWRY